MDVAPLLELHTKVGVLATVAVIVDIATELRKDVDGAGGTELADRLLEKLRFDTYHDYAATDLWKHLHETVTTTDLGKAKKLQKIVQQATAVNRLQGVRAETNLAMAANELLRGSSQYEGAGMKKPKETWDEIVKEDLQDIARLRREIDLIAKKGVLFALLHCVTEDKLDAVMDEVTDDNESILDDSLPAHLT